MRVGGRHRRADEGDGKPVDAEPAGLPTEVAEMLVAIAQRHPFGAPADDVATEPAGPILHDEAHLDGHVGIRRPTPLLGRVLVEDVAHRPIVASSPRSPEPPHRSDPSFASRFLRSSAPKS